MTVGKVYIVGAGPGHPELLTLKAADLIKKGDVIVYDRLVQEEVLALAKPSAEKIYMGKAVGQHESRQEEIHELLARKAGEGKIVIRLKGGDPFVFGRGGEEAEHLARLKIPFEVIPGVTSALAAPLSAGIPVTHRRNAACVAIVTGHEAKDDQTRLDWGALARLDTLVFLMGVKNSGRIARRLMESGKDPQTPAAMVQMAFWHDERVLQSTLSSLEEDVERAGIKPPATLVIGDTVRVREALAGGGRDLRRRPDGSSRFEPAPAPDQLLRLATAGLGTQILGYALENRLFDDTETLATAERLADGRGLNADAMGELLEALVALGLLEKVDGGFRNLELASRYLRSDSPQSLVPSLLQKAKRSVTWDTLEAYTKSGCRDFIPPGADDLHRASCDSLARFAAPTVADKLDLAEKSPVLLVGWGGEAYRKALAVRWPGLPFHYRNPFEDGDLELMISSSLPPNGRAAGTIILSELLSSCNRGHVQRVLEAAARWLKPGGLLVLHDAFLPVSVLPPPEVVLASLGRRMTQGGCRTWSIPRLEKTLLDLGFHSVRSEALPAGAVLVTALRTETGEP